MPRNAFPTPASSTDIKGRDGPSLSSLQLAFELPPPAVGGSSPEGSRQSQKPTPFPTQASETVKSRKRPSSSTTAQAPPPKDQFALPPPPTRSRKIIQMKPREEQAPSASKAAASSKTSAAAAPAAAGTKRKQPSATSAAGRKIARKTAHSLIERRRRSKMNEEFGVLKSLIPACSGEMHKLAILQASIEYVRYLEDCIKTLKEQGAKIPGQRLPSPAGGEPYNPDRNFVFSGGGLSPDVEMTSSEVSPAMTPNASRFQPPSMSPALLPERADSSSSISRHQSFSTSATTSPAFGPQTYGSYPQSAHSASGSALTSPALPPLRDLDQEATAALLMLNQTDRRGNGTSAVRGMSVRDLLSA